MAFCGFIILNFYSVNISAISSFSYSHLQYSGPLVFFIAKDFSSQSCEILISFCG